MTAAADAAAGFAAHFGYAPVLRVDAPGRVNLMGDHIDYNGLGVLPMAIQRLLTLYVRPRADTRVRVASLDGRFPECAFDSAAAITPGPAGDWCNYVRAAAQDVCVRHGPLRGLDAIIRSDIPVAAGLSSSSALVVASALALLHTNRIDEMPLALAERLMVAERYAGTHGGGMDQAIILGARSAHAARIDFQPLRIEHVAVPATWQFIVADSGVPAEKSRAMREAYNTRGVECAQALAHVAPHFPDCAATYPALLDRHGAPALTAAAADWLPDMLLRRFRHVVSEGHRVTLAVLALTQDDAAAFGALMDASHASLRDDFEVSSAELDRLVGVAKAAGATGARLTGAGFGGCIVALCTPATRAQVVQALRAQPMSHGSADVAERLVFVAEPSAGATLTALA